MAIFYCWYTGVPAPKYIWSFFTARMHVYQHQSTMFPLKLACHISTLFHYIPFLRDTGFSEIFKDTRVSEILTFAMSDQG